MEVFYQGVWGTVCDTFWDLEDANVICHQLGFGPATAAPERAAFGEGKGQIWLNWVRCQGNENSISDCSHNGWGNARGCDHGDDAGAICSPPGEWIVGDNLNSLLTEYIFVRKKVTYCTLCVWRRKWEF